MKLFYGSYDELLYEYYDCYDYYNNSGDARKKDVKIYRKDFTQLLLSSSVGGVEELQDIWKDAPDDTILSKFRSGELAVYGIVKGLFVQTSSDNNKITKAVYECFEDIIAPYISTSRRDDLIARLCDLIQEDDTISETKKVSLIDSASSSEGQFSKWLADVFLYAVLQDPPEAYVIENLPERKNRFYIERGTALKKIKEQFKANRTVCVSGMSGCGKTQLALAFAYEYAKDYKYICWINAGSEDDIIRSLNDFLSIVRAPNHNSGDYYSAVRDFHSWCNAHSYWLLIYDNAQYGSINVPYDISKFLPNSTKGNILFTTNNAFPHEDSIVLKLGVFSEATAIKYLTKRFNKRKPPVDSDALVQRLGFLPKAIEEACAFLLACPGVSIREYIHMLDERKPGFADRLIQDNPNKLTLYETSVLNFERIASGDAKMMLKMLSYFSESGFDLQMMNLVRFWNAKIELMPDSFLDSMVFYTILKELKTYSLCNPTLAKDNDERNYVYFGNTKSLICHKLTQEIVREYFDQDGSARLLALNLCHAAIQHCSAMTGDYYPIVPDILAFLANTDRRLLEITDTESQKKAAEISRFAAWALSDDDSRQSWLWDCHLAFTEKAYGANSVQTAYAYLEYFEIFAEKKYTDAFRRLNDAFLLLQDGTIANSEFDHNSYQKNDGYPSLCLWAKSDGLLVGYNQWRIICSVMAAVTLTAENKDAVSAKKFTKAQRDWFKALLTDFAEDWNAQGGDKLDCTEDINPEEILKQLDDLLCGM